MYNYKYPNFVQVKFILLFCVFCQWRTYLEQNWKFRHRPPQNNRSLPCVCQQIEDDAPFWYCTETIKLSVIYIPLSLSDDFDVEEHLSRVLCPPTPMWSWPWWRSGRSWSTRPSARRSSRSSQASSAASVAVWLLRRTCCQDTISVAGAEAPRNWAPSMVWKVKHEVEVMNSWVFTNRR